MNRIKDTVRIDPDNNRWFLTPEGREMVKKELGQYDKESDEWLETFNEIEKAIAEGLCLELGEEHIDFFIDNYVYELPFTGDYEL